MKSGRKKRQQSVEVKTGGIQKPLSQMTDEEFIASIDILSERYSRAYFNAKNKEDAAFNLSVTARAVPTDASVPNKQLKQALSARKPYNPKRGLFIALNAALMFVIMIVCVVGFWAPNSRFTDVFVVPIDGGEVGPSWRANIDVPDLFNSLKLVFKLDKGGSVSSNFYTLYIHGGSGSKLARFAGGVVPFAAAAVAVCAVLGFLIALFSLLSKNPTRGKKALGRICLAMLICAVILNLMGILASGANFLDALTLKSDEFKLGYGGFLFAAVPIAAYIIKRFSYRRAKRNA